MPNLIQLVQGTEQALPLYDPVHGSGPGEIVFRHMSIVQRGARSRATNQVRLASSTGDDMVKFSKKFDKMASQLNKENQIIRV
jgi:hypothetical protein